MICQKVKVQEYEQKQYGISGANTEQVLNCECASNAWLWKNRVGSLLNESKN